MTTANKRAISVVSQAIKRGDLKRMPCEICGKEKTHGHHDDYSKPLSVRWLCSHHHAEFHRQNGIMPCAFDVVAEKAVKPLPQRNPSETSGRKPKTDWINMPVGAGYPATSGAAHYQNRMAAGKRHYVYRCINGVGMVFRNR